MYYVYVTSPQLLITDTPYSPVYFLLPRSPPPFPHLRFCNPCIGFFFTDVIQHIPSFYSWIEKIHATVEV
jgi:hypothetical protein